MTTTRQATWREAKKGQLVQAKDLSIWRLEAMGKDDSGQIVVTMASNDLQNPREIQVRPPSYDSPVTFVEPLIDPPKLSSPSAAAAELGEKIRVAQEHAHAAVARANAEREAGTYAVGDQVEVGGIAFTKVSEEAIPYAEPMPDLTAYDEPTGFTQADVDALLDRKPAADLTFRPDGSVVAHTEHGRELLKGEYTTSGGDSLERSRPEALAVDPSEAAPIQSADEVWPVGPLDDASAGEMMTHLFLFHGDWQKENGKKGKSLLADLHRIHGEKEHGTGQSAGIHHEHRQKGNDAP